MKPLDIKSNSYAEHNDNSNAKDAKFKIGNNVRISKYKKTFAKGHAPNWWKEVFVISKIKNTVPWVWVIIHLHGEESVETFMKRNCKREIKKNLE